MVTWKRKKVDHWVDGDSGVFTDGRPFRLANVRAPERNQRGASRATKTAAGMTGRTDGRVSTKTVGRSYNRDVVQMKNRDGSVNDRMRRKGYRSSGR